MRKILGVSLSIIGYLILAEISNVIALVFSSYEGTNIFNFLRFIICPLITLVIFYFFFNKTRRNQGGFIKMLRLRQLTLMEGVKIGILSVSQGYAILIIIFYVSKHFEISQEVINLTQNGFGLFYIFIMGPILEEVLFRGIIFNKLRQNFKVTTAVIVQGLIFGFMHGNVYQISYTIIGGIIFGLVYVYTDSLYGSILLHILSNSVPAYMPDKIGTVIILSIVGIIITVKILRSLYLDRKRNIRIFNN